jgi:hypothetical protein
MDRREFIVGLAAFSLAGCRQTQGWRNEHVRTHLAKITATPGQRDTLIGLLLEGSKACPGA